MTVVSSKEFIGNQEKYFDMAVSNDVFVRNGKHMFHILCNPVAAVDKQETATSSALPFTAGLWEDYDIDDRVLRSKAWGTDKRTIQ